MARHLLPLIALCMAAIWPATAAAANSAKISPGELARVINRAGAGAAPYRNGKVSPSDIRVIGCIGPDEEPTEFECAWRQRTHHGWVRRKTWLAIDGRGWHDID